jgi:peptidoglycan/LPS O-acetylase OafA/YrhL
MGTTRRVSDTKDGLDTGGNDVTAEGVVDHPDGTVEVPEVTQQPAAAHPGTTKTWLPGIEALRGVAALTVVAHHSWSLSHQWEKAPDDRIPFYWIVEGFGLWGVMLFFMLSGYLLADTFWRTERADLRVYAIRRFFRIAPAYYVNLTILFLFFAAHRLVFSEQGAKQILANATFTHYLFPNYSSSLNVNGALWTLTIEMMLYAFLPLMALAVAFRPRFLPPRVQALVPWLATLGLIAIGLGWKAWVAFDGDRLRAFYFPPEAEAGNASLFIARQFFGAVAIFALGIIARWLVVHGHLDGVYRRLPKRLGVSSFLVLTIPSILLLKWVEQASQYTNPLLFTVYDFVVMLVLLPALLLAARPAQFSESPLRRVSTWLGERSYSIYLWHFPLILVIYERGPFKRDAAEGGYWWRLPAILALTLLFAAASYAMVERPGMEWGRRLAKRVSAGRRSGRDIKEYAA